MKCLEKNALPVSSEQTRWAVCMLCVRLYILLQFSSDANHSELASDPTSLKDTVLQKTPYLLFQMPTASFGFPRLPIFLINWL